MQVKSTQIVTFTSDMSPSDYYLAALKGAIYKYCEAVIIEDIATQIPAFDLKHAAYVVRNAYKYFPEKSIHVIHINAFESPNKIVCALVNNHYFISFDTGVLSLIFGEVPEETFLINEEIANSTSVLHVEGITRIIKNLVTQIPLKNFGRKESVKKLLSMQVICEPGYIKGGIIFIDKFSNAITNITKQQFETNFAGMKFEIEVGKYKITEISTGYGDQTAKELTAFFNTEGNLEIAIYQNKFIQLTSFKIDTIVFIFKK